MLDRLQQTGQCRRLRCPVELCALDDPAFYQLNLFRRQRIAVLWHQVIRITRREAEE